MTTTNTKTPCLTMMATDAIDALMRKANVARDSRLIGLCRAEMNIRRGVR